MIIGAINRIFGIFLKQPRCRATGILLNNNYSFSVIYIIVFINVISCHNDSKINPNQKPVNTEELIAINKAMVNEEQEQIEDYISRYGYKMNTTETGLHYMLLDSGQGESPGFRSIVTLKYRVNFLDGSYCYSSDSSGVLQFTLGQSDEPTGLQEGLVKMRTGGKAIFIIPSYLAYGLTGDGNKVGASQTLVYHVELLKVN